MPGCESRRSTQAREPRCAARCSAATLKSFRTFTSIPVWSSACSNSTSSFSAALCSGNAPMLTLFSAGDDGTAITTSLSSALPSWYCAANAGALQKWNAKLLEPFTSVFFLRCLLGDTRPPPPPAPAPTACRADGDLALGVVDCFAAAPAATGAGDVGDAEVAITAPPSTCGDKLDAGISRGALGRVLLGPRSISSAARSRKKLRRKIDCGDNLVLTLSNFRFYDGCCVG